MTIGSRSFGVSSPRPALLGSCAAVLAGCLLLSPCSARAAAIWDQSDLQLNAGSATVSRFLMVSDFTLDAPATLAGFSVWLVDGPTVLGGDGVANGIFGSFSGVLSWYVLADQGGIPGQPATVLHSGFDAAPIVTDTGIDRPMFIEPGQDDVFRVDAVIAPAVLLPAGTYWFGIREGVPGVVHDDTAIFWVGAGVERGEPAYVYIDGANVTGLFLVPAYEDRALILRDDVSAVPGPGSLGSLLAAIAALLGVGRAGRKRLANPGRSPD